LTSAGRDGNSSSIKGFTLLEVMVSLSIVAIVFVSLFKMQSSNILLAGYNKFHSTAPFLARQAITEIQRNLDKDSDLTGDFGKSFQGYQWKATVSDYETYDSKIISEKAGKQLKKLEIEILNGENRFILNTWRYLANE